MPTRNLFDPEAAILVPEIADEALEALASAAVAPAWSIVGAPTVSVVVACCGGDYSTAPQPKNHPDRAVAP